MVVKGELGEPFWSNTAFFLYFSGGNHYSSGSAIMTLYNSAYKKPSKFDNRTLVDTEIGINLAQKSLENGMT